MHRIGQHGLKLPLLIQILTKDSVTVSVDAVVYFRIFNAVISVINVEDAAKSTKLLAASTLRNILGTKSLHEILSDRESVAILIQVIYQIDHAQRDSKKIEEVNKSRHFSEQSRRGHRTLGRQSRACRSVS